MACADERVSDLTHNYYPSLPSWIQYILKQIDPLLLLDGGRKSTVHGHPNRSRPHRDVPASHSNTAATHLSTYLPRTQIRTDRSHIAVTLLYRDRTQHSTRLDLCHSRKFLSDSSRKFLSDRYVCKIILHVIFYTVIIFYM